MIGEGRRDDEGDSGATPWPFIGALTIIVLVLLGVWALQHFNRGDDTQREAVVRAALGQNDALQRGSYADFQANTCAHLVSPEAAVQARQQESVARRGARYVENVTGVSVDGDQAKADIVYYFAGAKDDKINVAASFVREDGTWRVCTDGP